MWWVCTPMAHSSWSSVEVKKGPFAASCQNRHPAGAFPEKRGMPSGTSFVIHTEIGGRASFSEDSRRVATSA